MHEIKRDAESSIRKLSDNFPVVAITGPRQSGKTTLARMCFPDKAYVSLEDPDIRQAALQDPRGFLGLYASGAIFDEVQRVPDLFSYLQGVVDRDRVNGRFVLTGSHQFLLNQHISQSLAGRVGYLTLLPTTRTESAPHSRANTFEEVIQQGFYPDPALHGRDPALWYGAYVQTYLEKDVRQLVQIQDLNHFQRFLRLCAARTGSLLDSTGLANEADINFRTMQKWLSVLEASHVIALVKPYHTNFNKRLIKTPKLYFLDPGLAAWLLGVRDPVHVVGHPLRGNLFETLVFSEILKHRCNRAETADIYFWRDSQRNEIDFVVDEGLTRIAIEVKPSQTIRPEQFKGLDLWSKLNADGSERTLLILGGHPPLTRRGNHDIASWETFTRHLKPKA